MNLRTGLAIGLTLAACLAGWILYAELTQARGALAWELRYVLAGLGVALLLSCAESVVARLANGRDAEPESHEPGD